MDNLEPVRLIDCKLLEGFWHDRAEIVRNHIIRYQWDAINDRIPGIEKSHAVQNFKIAAGEIEGRFYGRPFQDSDVYKWLEAVSYSITGYSNTELELLADSAIDLISKAQLPDGYLHTYYIIEDLDHRWSNVRDQHELYCAGHLIEAAVAYYYATGKEKLLNVAIQLADHIEFVFGAEEGKLKGYPGHAEIELALMKLYRCTKEERYLSLCQFFVDERGKSPHFFEVEASNRGDKEPYGPWMGMYGNEYNQSHLPVREQKVAVGHAVRAMYLYCAMSDLAKEINDISLLNACQTLWENVTNKQMYLTGSIGASHFGESFTLDYDLPNETAYNETCASIGLVMWAHRMLQMDVNSQYADVIETALYNGILSGVSLSGTKYFYVNPLETWPQSCQHRHDKQHVKTSRQEWFGSACCPPNLARLFASLGQYIYSKSAMKIYTHLYVNSEAAIELPGSKVTIKQTTSYPWKECVDFAIDVDQPAVFALGFRIPGWSHTYSIKLNGALIDGLIVENGYAHIERMWRKGDHVQVNFDMPIERIRANPQLRVNAGKVGLRRGPVVYCIEEVDNGPILADVSLAKGQELNARFEPDLLGGVVVISAEGRRSIQSSIHAPLYIDQSIKRESVPILAVPYFAWNNRTHGEMQVWIRED